MSNQQANTQNQPAVPDGQPAENSVYSISATWPPVPWPPQLVTKLSSLLPGQPTPPVSAVMHRYASWGTRLAATLIDSLIVGAGAFMLSIVAGIFEAIAVALLNADTTSAATTIAGFLAGFLSLLAIAACIVAACGYYVYFWSKTGQTLGKKAMGIKVIRADGRLLSRGQAVGRLLAMLLNTLGFGLGWLWPLWDEKKQGWHDKLAHTLVMQVR